MQQELITSYLKKGLQSGRQLRDLKNELATSGWAAQDIEDSYQAFIPHHHKSYKILGIIAFILLLAGIIAFGIYVAVTFFSFNLDFLKGSTTQKKAISTPTASPESISKDATGTGIKNSANPVSTPVSNWQSFKNPALGYSFEKPVGPDIITDYQIKYSPEGNFKGFDRVVITNTSQEKTYSIFTYVAVNPKSLDSWIKSGDPKVDFANYSLMTIDGKSGYQSSRVVNGSREYSAYVLNNGSVFVISYQGNTSSSVNDDTYQHILQSFQF